MRWPGLDSGARADGTPTDPVVLHFIRPTHERRTHERRTHEVRSRVIAPRRHHHVIRRAREHVIASVRRSARPSNLTLTSRGEPRG